jgi:hypothetical protein
MHLISKLIAAVRPSQRSRGSERSDLYDLSRLNPPRLRDGYRPFTHERLGHVLTGIPTKDLYALISRCDDAERRGFPWTASFWKEIQT